jgi:hypothetical protein
MSLTLRTDTSFTPDPLLKGTKVSIYACLSSTYDKDKRNPQIGTSWYHAELFPSGASWINTRHPTLANLSWTDRQ